MGTGSLACLIGVWYWLRRGLSACIGEARAMPLPALTKLALDMVLCWVPDLNAVATLVTRDGQVRSPPEPSRAAAAGIIGCRGGLAKSHWGDCLCWKNLYEFLKKILEK